MKYFLRVMFTPSCWLQCSDFSHAWDRQLNRLMETEKFVSHNKYTAQLGEKIVWIANHPYGSFNPYSSLPEVRPSRATILRAHDKLMEDLFP